MKKNKLREIEGGRHTWETQTQKKIHKEVDLYKKKHAQKETHTKKKKHSRGHMKKDIQREI